MAIRYSKMVAPGGFIPQAYALIDAVAVEKLGGGIRVDVLIYSTQATRTENGGAIAAFTAAQTTLLAKLTALEALKPQQGDSEQQAADKLSASFAARAEVQQAEHACKLAEAAVQASAAGWTCSLKIPAIETAALINQQDETLNYTLLYARVMQEPEFAGGEAV